MKKHNIEDIVSNDKIIRLAEILKRESYILISINGKDIHLQKSPDGGFDINVFEENTSLNDNEVKCDALIDDNIFKVETEIEAIVLAINFVKGK